ncbi:DUF418 domain-containing protein [Segetibacter aerophilus]|uniref:DUF418 domain-containing protein n=1 Tax=Segetibacter aerophilus TaxID=670293 RepID=A0A512B7X4_9BACT|nr:DUF418 domain-containing protein [Segetibacter aerophilus]GEO08060.1 hypothetical protein SAE01_05560 [Segetibacter aerophilus]
MSTPNLNLATPDQETPDIAINAEGTPRKPERIQPLDVLRAIALLGGLLVSIWIFGGLGNNRQLQILEHPNSDNYRLFSLVKLLIEGKMIALISLVFGAGVVLYLSRPNQQNKLSVPDLFIRRQMWLLGFGLLNALLFLWSGDILYHLAIVGILLFPFVRLSSKGLLIAAMITTVIFCGKNYWKYSDDKKAYNKYTAVIAFEKKLSRDSSARARAITAIKGDNKAIAQVKKDSLSKKQKADKQAWEGLLKNTKYDPKKDEGENKEMQTTSFADLWSHVLPATQNRESQWMFQTGVWEVASMMLFGMALLKFGFFENKLSRKQYLLIALAGFAVGILLGWFRLHYYSVSIADYTKYVVKNLFPYNILFPLEKLLMTVGYAALVMFLAVITRLSSFLKAVASVGRLALTNYLLQSIICSVFFTGYGMGYYGKLEQHELYFLAGEIWIVQIVFSIFWLQRFELGPAEWLWRCMTYGKWLPIRKNTSTNTEVIIPALT